MRRYSANTDWKLLEIFADNHFGFGRYESPIWIVGPGFNSLGTADEDIGPRLHGWHRRGQRELDDLREFMSASGEPVWFGAEPRRHRTWGKLCRMLLAVEGGDASNDEVRRYQAERFGARRAGICVIQLLAANPDADPWPFAGSPSAFLATPSAFRARYTARRARQIALRMRKHAPRAVIFFDRTHRRIWEDISGTPLQESDPPSCSAGATDGINLLMIRHPESVGTTNEYFEHVGQLVADLPSR